MIETTLLQDLGVLLVGGMCAAVLLKPLRVPPLVAYIVAGLVLGPVLGLLHVTPTIHLISELGVALLLFLVGLEMSLARIRDVGRVAVLAGLAQVVVVGAAGFGVGLLAGMTPGTAVLTGVAVSFSSTAVVVKLLTRERELGERHGQLALGILLTQDVVVIVVLTALAGLAAPEAGGSALGRRLAEAGVGTLLLVGGAAVASRHLLPRLFRRVVAERETLFVLSLAWCFLFIVAAEAFHLSVELGAFVAGLAVAQLPVAHDLSRRVGSLTTFFLAVFFVSLGVELEPARAAASVGAVVALTALVLPGKGIVVAWLLARLGEDEEAAVRTGLVLSQASEFSFVLVAAAATAGLGGAELAPVVGVVGVVTIAASAFGIVESGRIYHRLRGTPLPGLLGARDRRRDREDDHRLRDHVIVVGMNPLGRSLVRRLSDAGARVLAIDTDPRKLAALPATTLQGTAQDPTVLDEARLQEARLLVSALRIEDVNEVLAHRCREAGVPASIHAFDPSVVDRLLETKVDHLIFSRDGGTRRVVRALRNAGVLR